MYQDVILHKFNLPPLHHEYLGLIWLNVMLGCCIYTCRVGGTGLHCRNNEQKSFNQPKRQLKSLLIRTETRVRQQSPSVTEVTCCVCVCVCALRGAVHVEMTVQCVMSKPHVFFFKRHVYH